MTVAPTIPAARLRTAGVVVGVGYLALLAVALLARSSEPRLWTWTAAFAVAGAVAAAVLGGSTPSGPRWAGADGLGAGMVLLTLVLAAVVAGVGGLGGLALATGAYPAVALWSAARRSR